jgi:hypothetical protein
MSRDMVDGCRVAVVPPALARHPGGRTHPPIHVGGEDGCASGDESATASRRPWRNLAAPVTPARDAGASRPATSAGATSPARPTAAAHAATNWPTSSWRPTHVSRRTPEVTHPRSDRTCGGGSSSASSSSSFSADAGCFRGSTRPRGPTGEPVESAAERQRCGDPAGRRRGGHRSSATRPAPSAAVQMCAAAARCG